MHHAIISDDFDIRQFQRMVGGTSAPFLGNGAQKFKEICNHPNARFTALNAGAGELIRIGLDAFQQQHFSDTAYAEPFYGKAFHSTQIHG